jgi:outer membrane protein OmpA-like peptidoglycan-associated protein
VGGQFRKKMTRIKTFIISLFVLTSVHGQTFKINSTSVDVGQTFTVWDIHFALAKADLIVEGVSKSNLDSIADFFKNNPTANVELGYHTDNRGKANSNLILSQQRAESVKKYIIGQGVDSLKITAKGYGSTKPLISKEDEIKNARTQNHCEPPYPPYRGNKRLTIKITKK